MHQKPHSALKKVFYPYIFILKEGTEIKKDLLDYSLMMLFVHAHETIKSPQNIKNAVDEIN